MQDDRDLQQSGILTASTSQRGAISSFVVMDVMRTAWEREAKGQDIIHMEVGQPGTPAPRKAREAAREAIDSQVLGYTDALGMTPLRERIARHYRDSYNLDIAPSRIIITAGSSAGFVLTFLALFDPGQTILLPEPGYPCYRNIVSALGLEPLAIPLSAKDEWRLSQSRLAHAFPDGTPPRGSGILFASPANPTGTVIHPQALSDICRWCETNGVTIISDEIYHGLTYDAPAETALRYSDNAIVINSFSKYFSMTGWRIGWMVVPEALTRTMERLAQNFYISPTTISQIAALAALDATEELEANKSVYARNRAMLMEELPRAGFTKLAPADGAFYVYADISGLTDDSEAYARRILDEIGVAATPGIDFDPARGRHFLRFSYAGTYEHMREAMQRLKTFRK